jgi:hypothetical protein
MTWFWIILILVNQSTREKFLLILLLIESFRARSSRRDFTTWLWKSSSWVPVSKDVESTSEMLIFQVWFILARLSFGRQRICPTTVPNDLGSKRLGNSDDKDRIANPLIVLLERKNERTKSRIKILIRTCTAHLAVDTHFQRIPKLQSDNRSVYSPHFGPLNPASTSALYQFFKHSFPFIHLNL